MAIQPIGPELIGLPGAAPPGEPPQKAGGSFLTTLQDSIRQVNEIQAQADQAVTDLAVGKNQDLHQTMIALEKADISFQLMMQVRNKIVSAYEEILRMQI